MKRILVIIFMAFLILLVAYATLMAATAVTCSYDCEGHNGISDWKHEWNGGQYADFTKSPYITSTNGQSWTLGSYIGIGGSSTQGFFQGWFDIKEADYFINIHYGTFLERFLARDNKNLYCIEHGQSVVGGKKQYVARIEIDGDTVTAYQYNGPTLNGTNSNDARKSTRQLVEIIKQANEAAANKSTYTDSVVGTEYLRERGETSSDANRSSFVYGYDVYQRMMWKHLSGWKNEVFGKECLTTIAQLPSTGTSLTSSELKSKDVKFRQAAEDKATELYDKLINRTDIDGTERTNDNIEVNDVSSPNMKNNELRINERIENYTLLGPFKYNFVGTVETVEIYFNNNKNNVTTTKIGRLTGSSFTEISGIKANENFYVKVPTDFLTANITTLNIDITVAGEDEQKTVLYLLAGDADAEGTANETYTWQNHMYVEQTFTPIRTTGRFSYLIETSKTVTLEKKSTDGIMLPNVTFKLCNEDGTYINTYTTGESGTVSIPNIEIGKNYTLEETSNTSYGGRGANIGNATITTGGTITNIDKENRKITFRLTDNATLVITNTINLGKLTIRKIDDTSGETVKLSGIGFMLWDMSVGGWVRLYDKNTSEFITKIDVETEINILDYIIEPASPDLENTPPTIFTTNSNGEIVINNLQIDHSTTKKDHYLVAECQNNNYGYKGMILESGNIQTDENDESIIVSEGSASIKNGTLVKFDGTESCIRQSDKTVKFSIDKNTILTIKNTPKLGDLSIIKTGEENDTVPLPNVKFVIWKKDAFIRLIDEETGFVEEITSDEQINVTDYEMQYTTNVNLATKFVTNEAGKIDISNLEVYLGVDSEGNPIPYGYTIREVENENYGYKAMILGEDTITINGKPVGENNLSSSVDANKKEIKFTMEGDTSIIINIKNTPEFGNLTIEKVGGEGDSLVKQQGVEFELWQLAGGYVRLFTEEEYKEGETRLEFVDTVKSENGEPIDFKNYVIEYVTEVTENTLPTRFITNELGQIQINNLEIYHRPGGQNHHFISEVKNDNYGYKGMIIEEATIVGGELRNFDNTESYIRQRDRAVKFTITENTKLTIKNKPQLGNVLINKESTDGEVLQNVEFIMTRGENEYIVLKDSNGKNLNPNEIDTEAIIDINGQFENNEYSIEYSTNKDDATVFITGKEGTIDLKNLEVYQPYVISRPKPVSSDADKNTEVIDTQPTSYSYTIQEILNPNYGYVLTNTDELLVTINQLNPGATTEKTVLNESATRNLEIVKKDADAEIYLGKVGFVICTTTEGSAKKGYLSVYDENNNFVPNIIGEVTINNGYTLEYKYFYNEYEDLEDNEKLEITKFETNGSGKLNINNLEVYERETAKTYEYQLIELYNENFGYEINPSPTEGIVLEKQDENEEDTKTVTVLNKQVYAKLSGYVWKEYADPKKTNPSDLLYNESSADIKLTDLYIWNESKGLYEQNTNAEIPVKILLIDIETKKIIKEPDSFIYKSNSSTEKVQDAGKYTFEVEIAKLGNYQIVFEYDGFYYSTIIPNSEKDNGSKAVENETDRTELNNKFGTIEPGDKIVSSDGENENGVIYDEVKEQKSSLLGFVDENLTKVQAKTSMKLLEKFENAKKDSEVPVVGIDHINMGLAQREQPILWITSNINSVEVNLENGDEKHKYTYDYSDAEIQMFNEEYYYNEEDGEYKSVKGDGEEEKSLINKLGEESEIPNFKAKIVKSDIQAAKAQKQQIKMGVSTIYRISLNNASGKLTSVVHEIKNYFDARFTIEEIGLSIDGNQIGNIIYKAGQGGNIVIEENVNVENADITTEELIYNSVIIPLGDDGISLKSLKTSHIYIKYSLKEEYIEKLLKENITCNNATEIIKYSSYYEDSLGKGKVEKTENGKKEVSTEYIITENQNSSRTGQIYAGINQGNRPDNLKLKLKSVINEQNTACIFDTSEYEIDSTAAPAIIICADGVRTISGTIFEDYAEVINNEKNGNGKYDESVDSLISNVKVELYQVDEKGAQLSNEPVLYADNSTPIVTEAVNGKYTLGGYTDENGNTYGILPGKYIVQYTYGTYKNSNGEEKQTYSGNKNDSKGKIKYINMMDYKSTIIPEESELQAEFKNNISDGNINKSWFTLQEEGTYSTAIDNLLLREEYTSPVSSVTYGILRGKGVIMTNQNGIPENKPMEKDVMTAKTLPMDINIHFTKEDETKVVNKDENGQIQEKEDLALTLENVNFGIVERPNIDIKIDKKITNIEVIAQNGASIIPKGNPRDDKMQYITAPDDEEAITAQVDPKLLQGATLNVEYTVTVENNSNIDYICKEYYYFAEGNEEFENTPTAKLVVDYLDATTELDETKVENEVWKKETAESLKSNEYINQDVYSTLTSNGEDETYYAYTTSAFEDVKIGDGPKSEKMYVSRKLSISEDITEKGRVEIIEIAGSRAITGATPGNYNPAESAGTDGNTDYLNEPDWSGDEVKFMPPTGIIVDYKMYMIAIVAMLTILTIGIIVIKKKVII